ncbi:MAG: DNA-binding protein [Nitriliruptor sp.]|nr:MAG: DNA-binding protein [Nitriliruptor sp.]
MDAAPSQARDEAAAQLGITTCTLYRLIDSGQLPAYDFGRVIRLKESEVGSFVEAARIVPGELEHLYTDVKHADEESRSRLGAWGRHGGLGIRSPTGRWLGAKVPWSCS